MRKLGRGGEPLSAGAWGTGLEAATARWGQASGGTKAAASMPTAISIMPGGGRPAGLRRGLPATLEGRLGVV